MNRKGIKSKEWDSTQILINIYGIASAMSYLHSNNILHNNLKSSNIFIDKNLRPKVTDYGFYTKLQILKNMSCRSSSRMRNNPNYTAPEILISNEATKASDVYSFAMIMFEMLTKEKPSSNLKTTNEFFTEVVVKCCRPKFPEKSKEEVIPCFREMIEMCWSQKPNERMTFNDIVYALKNDPRFVANDVDKEKFFSYVNMIDNKHKIEIHQKIEENEQQKIEENVEHEKDSEQTSTQNSSPQSEVQNQQQPAITIRKDLSKEQNQQTSLIDISQDSIFQRINNKKFNQLHLHKVQRQSKFKVAENDESLISTSYNEVRDYKNSLNWILVKFDASTKKWVFFNKGSNGQEEMKNRISSDFIGYCYLRIENRKLDINRPLFILIKYVPAGTKMMTKANMNARRGEIESILDYKNICIEAETKDDISEEINKKLK